MRSHLITADASSAYILRCDPWGFIWPHKTHCYRRSASK